MILYFNEHIELVATVQQYEKLQPKSEAEICTETSETETTVFNMEVSKEDVTLRCCSRSYVRIYYICLCLEKKNKKKRWIQKKMGGGAGRRRGKYHPESPSENSCSDLHKSTAQGKSLVSASIYLSERISIPCPYADRILNHNKKKIFF